MPQIVKATTRHGPFYCVASDEFIALSLIAYGEFSQSELDIFSQIIFPGMTVVEVGANIGAHTVPMARLCAPGTLHAFEPQQLVYQLLCANLVVNDIDNVLAYSEACGAGETIGAMRRLTDSDATNPGSESVRPLEEIETDPALKARSHRVRITPLDHLYLDRCDLLKIDVEGMEADVISGARETITRCRPIIYTENDRLGRQAGVIGAIDVLGYRQYWHMAKMHNPNNFKGSPNLFGDLISLNMLCIPSERDMQVGDLILIDPAHPTAPEGIDYPSQ